jgi:DNA-binding NtrC family response regulator/NO-binding membrane sensor protein with MHYT domain
LIASIASYAVFGLSGRMKASEKTSTRTAWLAAGATTMGMGVWAMHFIGMLALRLPIPVTYEIQTTLLSVIPSILAAGVVLLMMSRKQWSIPLLLLSGMLMGLGIGAMHYTGMMAMQLAADMYYDSLLFVVSLVVAVILATLSLYIGLRAKGGSNGGERLKRGLVGAPIMGIAISGMHYTGMAAVYFFPTAVSAGPASALDPMLLGILVTVATVSLLALVICVAAADARLKIANAKIEHETSVARSLQDEARERSAGSLLGQSIAVRALREAIGIYASNDRTLFLTGPPGAGQEAVARAIHHESRRSSRPFIHLDCALLNSGEQSLLFGERESGTVPGVGKFVLADGGTVFIENVDKLSDQRQDQLADILDMCEHRPRQDDQAVPDVRVIAFSAAAVSEKDREALFSPRLLRTLCKHQLSVPPLAERRDDIPVITRYFIKQFARKFGKPVEDISDESLERLQTYRWPGNIQELQILLERLVVTSSGRILEVEPSILEEGIPLDRYRLIQKLGSGGMGEVWLGKHQLLARPVAIKLIRTDATGHTDDKQATMRRFQREAQITATLNSPHTIRLYDFGVSESGSFYFVMELLNGLSLKSIVERFGPLIPERAVMLLQQACRSLSEAHEVGLVHRDIKPGNIFVCKMGSEYDFLKVLDFGMVKEGAELEQTTVTGTGGFVGTPAFAAPEVILGQAVDSRADLYGVGCVAYWMLTGRPPFEAANVVQLMLEHTQRKPSAPSEDCKFQIPAALDDIVLACLEKLPKDRPSSALKLWEELNKVELGARWTQNHAASWWKVNLPDGGREP